MNNTPSRSRLPDAEVYVARAMYNWVHSTLSLESTEAGTRPSDIFSFAVLARCISGERLRHYADSPQADPFRKIIAQSWLVTSRVSNNARSLTYSDIQLLVPTDQARTLAFQFIDSWKSHMRRIRTDIPEEDYRAAAVSAKYIGIFLLKAGELDKYLEWFEKSFNICRYYRNARSAGLVAMEIGELLVLQGRDAEAVKWYGYFRLYKYRSDGPILFRERMEALMNLLKLYVRLKMSAKAEECAQEILQSEENEIINNLKIYKNPDKAIESAKYVSEVYRAMNDQHSIAKWEQKVLQKLIYPE